MNGPLKLGSVSPLFVMAGLVPAIHAVPSQATIEVLRDFSRFAFGGSSSPLRVAGRVKPGHDAEGGGVAGMGDAK